MNLQRFLYTSLPGRGFVELASDDNIPTRLKEAIRQPQAATVSRGFDAGLGVAFWESNSSVVCTYLERTQDEHKRYFVASHSVCMPLETYRKMAPHFEEAILTPLQEGVAYPLADGRALEPLPVPQPDSRKEGINSEDLEILNEYVPDGKRLEALLACLIDGKDFTLTIQTDLEWEAIKVTVALLKVAAAAGVYPQPETGIATFTQSRGIPNLYGSKVLPDSRLRVISELAAQSERFSKRAQSIAQRLVEEVVTGNVKGIDHAILTGDARARTPSTSSGAPSPAEKPDKKRRPGGGTSDRGQRDVREAGAGTRSDPELQEWERELAYWQRVLDDREKNLEEWQKSLSTESATLDVEKQVVTRQREEVRRESEELALQRSRPGDDEFWKLYVQLDKFLQARQMESHREHSVRALKSLLDGLRKGLRSRSVSRRKEVSELLDDGDVKHTIAVLSRLAGLTKEYALLIDTAKRERRWD